MMRRLTVEREGDFSIRRDRGKTLLEDKEEEDYETSQKDSQSYSRHRDVRDDGNYHLRGESE